MPSDLIRGWEPVRAKKTRQNRNGSKRQQMPGGGQ
jgi:hypothetical protein